VPMHDITMLCQRVALGVHGRCTGNGGLPLRLLDNFSISGGKRGSLLMGLEALHARSGASLTLRGALLPAAGRSAKRDGEIFRTAYRLAVQDVSRAVRCRHGFVLTAYSLCRATIQRGGQGCAGLAGGGSEPQPV
jgi:hypothetical protein